MNKIVLYNKKMINGEDVYKRQVNHNAIFFTLTRPQCLSIEFNGDRLHNLHLFANPLETETYTESSDKNNVFQL